MKKTYQAPQIEATYANTAGQILGLSSVKVNTDGDATAPEAALVSENPFDFSWE